MLNLVFVKESLAIIEPYSAGRACHDTEVNEALGFIDTTSLSLLPQVVVDSSVEMLQGSTGYCDAESSGRSSRHCGRRRCIIAGWYTEGGTGGDWKVWRRFVIGSIGSVIEMR